ncbi:hypothetical protein BC832DRAFT_548474 [Gaertneriomyces semiglobifer]|nr:hypothetical protein BC832DRAFT_548474 [Gaertneriomyces semiglobifer]
MLATERNDHGLIELLSHLDQYESLRQDTAEALRQAFIDLAQTKYSLGPGRITRLQYDSRMVASRGVQLDQATGDYVQVSLKSNHSEKEKDPELFEEDDECRDSSEREGLRRRRTDKEGAPDDQADPRVPAPENTVPAQTNPITWFSALPPPSLRSSQDGFIRALKTLVELANVTRRVNELTAQEMEDARN